MKPRWYIVTPKEKFWRALRDCRLYAKEFGRWPRNHHTLPPKLRAGDTILCYSFSALGSTAKDVQAVLEQCLSLGVIVIQVKTNTQATKELVESMDLVVTFEQDMAERKHNELLGIKQEWGGVFNGYSEWTTNGKIKRGAGVAKVDNRALWQLNAPPSQWIDEKILAGWTTDRIVEEFKCLARLMPEIWHVYGGVKGGVSKHYVNMRRLQLIR